MAGGDAKTVIMTKNAGRLHPRYLLPWPLSGYSVKLSASWRHIKMISIIFLVHFFVIYSPVLLCFSGSYSLQPGLTWTVISANLPVSSGTYNIKYHAIAVLTEAVAFLSASNGVILRTGEFRKCRPQLIESI